MAKEGLTAKQVEHAKPSDKQIEIPAGPPAGLYLVVKPNGKKTWRFRYRYRGRTRGVMFPKAYPKMGLAAARAEAESRIESLKNDKDPAVVQAEEIKQETPDMAKAIADEWIKRHVKRKTTERTAREYERILKIDVLSGWKDRYITEIRKRDVRDLLNSIVDRGATIHANKVLAVLKSWFSWCVENEYLDASPIANLGPPSKNKTRDRTLDPSELSEVWNATDALGYPLGPFVRCLILTAQRRGEVAAMKWADVDLDQALWLMPPEFTYTGSVHVVPLSKAAVTLLKSLPRFRYVNENGREVEGEYIWTTTSGRKAINGFSKSKERIDKETLNRRAAAKIDKNILDWTMHDLRRTAATLMAKHGVLPHILSAILGHASAVTVSTMPSATVTKIYNRYTYLDEKREALEAWAQYVVNLGKPISKAASA